MKTSTQILRLIRQGESEAVEFKESFGREVVEAVCAFANAKGGVVLVGVADSGNVQGVQIGKGSLKDAANQIAQGTGLHPSVETASAHGKTILVICIEESRIKPVMFHGRAYVRVGNTTRLMSQEQLTRTVLKNAGITWDELAESRASLVDIDLPKVREFIQLVKEKKRRPLPAKIQPRELLKRLELLHDGRPTRAAVLLFGKNPQRFYGHVFLKIGRFRNETLIVDDREVHGTLFEQVAGAMDYFREKLDTRFVMTGRPERDVIWEYPLEALREAVTNAVCHRDHIGGGHTQIRIYDDKIMVWNSGGLPEGLFLKTLKKNRRSVQRNRLVAAAFFYAGLIERWGGGIEKMLTLCADAGHPAPVFEEEMGFRVTFKKPLPREPDRRPASTGQAPDKYRTSTGQAVYDVRLLRYCRSPRKIRQIMAYAGLRHRETFLSNHLYPLLKAGLLTMTAPDSPRSPKQSYVVTAKGLAAVKEAKA